MFQNAGEAVSYAGLALVVIFMVRVIIAKIRRLVSIGRPPPPFSKSRFLISALLLVVGCVLAGVGDSYRVSMSKDISPIKKSSRRRRLRQIARPDFQKTNSHSVF